MTERVAKAKTFKERRQTYVKTRLNCSSKALPCEFDIWTEKKALSDLMD